MDIPSALTKDEEHPGFYSASYPGASDMMGIIPHESPTRANRSKTSSRPWVEEPASSPFEENSGTSLSLLGISDDSASTVALASESSSPRPHSIADFRAVSQDLYIQSEDNSFFDATSFAEQDSLPDSTPRAEQDDPFDETPRAEKANPFESIKEDEMHRRRFSLPFGSSFKSDGADDTSKKARRFSIFSPGHSPNAERAIGQSKPSQSIEGPDELENEDTGNRSVNQASPVVQDFGAHNDTVPGSVVSLSPGRRTISRQSAAIYGLPPTSGTLRALSDGSPTKQDGNAKAMFPDYNPITSLHPTTASVAKVDRPAANQSQRFQRPDNWFHQGLVDDDAYCTQQGAREDDTLDTCSTHNDVLPSSSPKSSYTLKRPQHIIPKQSRAPKASEQTPKRADREPDVSTKQPTNAIANIDLEFLARPDLSAKQKAKSLDDAIATAKHIAKTTGLPLMILKDHKSDVVVLRRQQAKWLSGASEWKARVLAEAETAKDKRAIIELQQLGLLSKAQTRTLSLPVATVPAPEAGLPPSTPSSNQRPQTLSKAHEILGLATPPRMAPVASPKRRSPRAGPQYQHKPFRSSRSPSMVKLREDACSEPTSATPAKEKEVKGEEAEERLENKEERKEGEEELSYWWEQLRLLNIREDKEHGVRCLAPMSPEEREILRHIDWEIMKKWGWQVGDGA